MFLYVSVCVTGKDKVVASVGDQSFCHKGSDSGLIAARICTFLHFFFSDACQIHL